MPLRGIAIHGSARRRGNSRLLLDELIEAVTDVRPDLEWMQVHAYYANVDPCIACGGCEEDQVGCVREHDGWSELETALRAADVLCLSSPVYFMGLPAPVKAIIDRLQALWWHRERGGQVATNEGPFRRAALILTAAGGEGTFAPSRRMAKAAFNTLRFEQVGEVLGGELEHPDDAASRQDLLGSARELGRKLVE
jgi:multimeric flavodoxin WrbA